MNIRLAIACSAVLAIALSACDRRELEPVEPADSASTTIVDNPAVAPGGDVDTTQDPCFGLTGQAETDCRASHDPAVEEDARDNPAPVGD